MSSNTVDRAMKAINEGEVSAEERKTIRKLLDLIEKLEVDAAAIDEQRNELKAQAAATAETIAEAHEMLAAHLPRNPIPPQSIGR